MSEIKPDAQMNDDRELRALLDEWRAPSPSESLDKRVVAAYRRQITDAVQASNPMFSQRDSEVVKMKQCSTCHEEFADKFSFCPVDGTPLPLAGQAAATQAARNIEPEPTLTQPTIPALSYQQESPQIEMQALAPVDDSYHLTILDDAGLISRLTTELKAVAHQSQLTWPEFKRDPLGFTKRSISSYAGLLGRFVSQPGVGAAMGVAVGSMLLLMLGVILLERTRSAGATRAIMVGFGLLAVGMLITIFSGWFSRDNETTVGVSRAGSLAGARNDSNNALAGMIAAFVFIFFVVGGVIGWNFYNDWRHKQIAAADRQREDLEYMGDVSIPQEQETPKPGAAGMNKGNGGGSKPQYERPHGGGGGGREEQTPASAGRLPQASLTIPQVLAPDPHPPNIPHPSLPTAATINADPLLFPTDTRPLPYGDPHSTSTTPSSGPGTGNGIGTGAGGGVGSGEGGGVGPGRGGNTGGGDNSPGGGGPGGGGGGYDPNHIFQSREVTVKARILFKPEAPYTEEARRNQITGTVVLRAVLSSNGSVTGIRPVRTLPNGLTEQAIAAAQKIKFVPAQHEGRNVSQYIQIEYNFNLY
ncbi:MAG TPA: energy transducer TonB [Pyrinomonadaceae bacterium]|nr:energy transducer TonB [Pyrinomonadaceae bacterium]